MSWLAGANDVRGIPMIPTSSVRAIIILLSVSYSLGLSVVYSIHYSDESECAHNRAHLKPKEIKLEFTCFQNVIPWSQTLQQLINRMETLSWWFIHPSRFIRCYIVSTAQFTSAPIHPPTQSIKQCIWSDANRPPPTTDATINLMLVQNEKENFTHERRHWW